MADTLYAQPGAKLYLDTYAWSTTQVGTLSIKLVSLADRSLAIAAQTSGIAFDSATKAHWIDTLTAPSTAGSYDAVFTDASGVQATQRVEVTASSALTISPSGSDLTTLARVKDWLGV